MARLVQRRVPRAEQALACAPAERLGQQVIQEGREDKLRRDAEESLSQPDLRPSLRGHATHELHLRLGKGAPGLHGEEPADRGQEGDRRRLRGSQAVQLVRVQLLHAGEKAGEPLRRSAMQPIVGVTFAMNVNDLELLLVQSLLFKNSHKQTLNNHTQRVNRAETLMEGEGGCESNGVTELKSDRVTK